MIRSIPAGARAVPGRRETRRASSSAGDQVWVANTDDGTVGRLLDEPAIQTRRGRGRREPRGDRLRLRPHLGRRRRRLRVGDRPGRRASSRMSRSDASPEGVADRARSASGSPPARGTRSSLSTPPAASSSSRGAERERPRLSPISRPNDDEAPPERASCASGDGAGGYLTIPSISIQQPSSEPRPCEGVADLEHRVVEERVVDRRSCSAGCWSPWSRSRAARPCGRGCSP